MTPLDGQVRVALVDDDLKFAQWVEEVLREHPQLVWLGGAATLDQARSAIPALQPAVILLDIQLPSGSGIDLIPEFRKSVPKAEILMLTVFEDTDKLFRSLSLGARGFLTKRAGAVQLVEAINGIAQGESPITPSIARRLLDEVFGGPRPDLETGLTAREWEVLNHVAQGCLNKEIALRLGISPETVRAHLYRIYRKLEVNTRGQAVRKAFPGMQAFSWPRRPRSDG